MSWWEGYKCLLAIILIFTRKIFLSAHLKLFLSFFLSLFLAVGQLVGLSSLPSHRGEWYLVIAFRKGDAISAELTKFTTNYVISVVTMLIDIAMGNKAPF